MANTSQLVTIDALNTVWDKGVIPLCKEIDAKCTALDDRLDNIGTVYKFKKAFIKWTDEDDETEDFIHYTGNDLYPIKRGDTISVNEEYPVYSKDPDNYPQYTPGAGGRLFICTQETTQENPVPDYSIDAKEWEKYWTPIDLNLQVASDSQYGVIKLRNPRNDSSTDRSLLLNGGAHVEIPIGTRGEFKLKVGNTYTPVTVVVRTSHRPSANADKFGTYCFTTHGNLKLWKCVENPDTSDTDHPYVWVQSSDDVKFYPGIKGLLSVGEGLVVDEDGVISIKIKKNDASDPKYEEEGLQIDPTTGRLKNFGIWSVRDSLASSGYTNLYHGNLVITSATDGKITFTVRDNDEENSNKSFDVPIFGWGDKQDKKTAVTHNENTSVGFDYKPIYVSSNGEATAITALKLGLTPDTSDSSILHIKKGNDGQTYPTAAIIDGGSKTDLDPGHGETGVSDVALWVKGRLSVSNCISASKVYHAVWNDISDAIEVQDDLKTDPGYCYYFDGTEYHRTTKYCQKGIIGIHSDTAGSVLGRKGKHKELDISVGGFVLAYVDKYYEPGTPLTSAPDGHLTKMSLWSRIFHPERLVATYWKPEMEAEWGDDTHTVEVNGRHWVKVR